MIKDDEKYGYRSEPLDIRSEPPVTRCGASLVARGEKPLIKRRRAQAVNSLPVKKRS